MSVFSYPKIEARVSLRCYIKTFPYPQNQPELTPLSPCRSAVASPTPKETRVYGEVIGRLFRIFSVNQGIILGSLYGTPLHLGPPTLVVGFLFAFIGASFSDSRPIDLTY